MVTLRLALLSSVFSLCVGATSSLHAQEATATVQNSGPGLFVHLDGGISHLSDATDTPAVVSGLRYGLRAGPRWEKTELFLHVSHNAWIRARDEFDVTRGVLNVMLGGGYRSFENRISSSIAVGTSTLLFDTFLDEIGTTGIAMDARPAGIRWPIGEVTLVFDPLHVVVQAPVLSEPRLVRLQYHTTLTLEWDSW